MTRWFCSECGAESVQAPPSIGTFTSIDVRERYNLGYCPGNPSRRTAVISDAEAADLIAMAVLDGSREAHGDESTW